MIGRHLIIVAGAILLLVTAYSSWVSRQHYTEHQSAVQVWKELENQDVRLNEHMLMVRSSALHNYDQLVLIVGKIHALEKVLKGQEHDHVWKVAEPEIEALFKLLQKKVALLEKYKADYAILNNSQRYLPGAIEALQNKMDMDERARMYDLASDVFVYIAMPSEEIRQHIEAMKGQLLTMNLSPDVREGLINLYRHVNVVVEKGKKLGELSDAMLALPTGESIRHICSYYEQEHAQEVSRNDLYRVLLAVLAMLLLLAVSYVLKRQQQMSQALQDALNEVEYQKFALDQHSIVAVTDRAGRITYANDKFCEISQYSRDELLGQDHRILNSGYHPREFFVDMWKIIGKGQIWQGQVCNRRKDGQLYWVDTSIVPFMGADGKVERYVAIRTDITHQREMEAQIVSSQRFLLSVMDTLGEGVYALDKDGNCTFVNAEFERLLGWSRDEVLGKNMHDIVHFQDADGVPVSRDMCPVHCSINQGKVFRSTTDVFTHKNKTQFPISIVAAPLLDDGEVVGSVAVFQDVSEQKRYETELREARDEAMESSRMKSMFLSTVSHEIRTPMNGIIGMTDLLLDSPLGKDQQEFARTIHASAEALLTIINDILDFSKVEAGHLEIDSIDFSLSSVVEGATSVAAYRASKPQLRVQCFIDPTIPPVLQGDPGRLRQVLLNLADNAVKFTDEGSVTVNVMLLAQADARVKLRFIVQDTGIGIAPEAQKRLFQPFVQADGSTTRKYGGTGLGLAICKRIVELMGGDIRLSSEVGQGSSFEFELEFPVSDIAGEVAGGVQLADASPMRVLLVSEDTTATQYYKAYFDAWHVDAVIHDMDLAVAGLLQENPRLLVVDSTRQGEDGFRFLEQVRDRPRLAKQPAILFSNHLPREAQDASKAMPYTQVLGKPLRMSQLYDAMVSLLHEEEPVEHNLVDFGALSADRFPVSGHMDAALEGRLILLVEDNPVNQKVAQMHLQKLGYAVHTVGNGQEAVLAAEGASYAAILMDCQMPVMDGFEATHAIRRREKESGQHVPIIAMTANAMKGDRERCLAVGMDDYLSKPISRQKLGEVVGKWKLGKSEACSMPVNHSENEEAVIDLGYLRDLVGDDSQILCEMLDIFAQSMQSLVTEKLQQAVRDGDYQAVCEFAHELKGAASNIGGKSIAMVCANLEQAAQAGDGERLVEGLRELSDSLQAVRALRIRLGGAS